MQKKTLNRNAILSIIGSLALSQGFYSRLLRDLQILHISNPNKWERIMQHWESLGFTSSVELVEYLEA